MKTLLRILLHIAALGMILLVMPSCSLKPTVIDGSTKITLGASLGTKSSSEWATVTSPTGWKLEYGTTGKDETGAIKSYITGDVMKFAAGATAGVMKHTNTTGLKTVQSNNGVTTHLSDNAAKVEIAKIPPP